MTPAIEGQAPARPLTATVEQTLGKMLETVRASAVFGQPMERGETTIIPCSEIIVGMGMGSGMGTAQAQQEGETSGGEGAGGGGGGRGRPVAAIVVTPAGVRIEPIVDVTKVAMAGVTAAAFVLVSLARMTRATRGMRGSGPSMGRLAKALRS